MPVGRQVGYRREQAPLSQEAIHWLRRSDETESEYVKAKRIDILRCRQTTERDEVDRYVTNDRPSCDDSAVCFSRGYGDEAPLGERTLRVVLRFCLFFFGEDIERGVIR